MYDLFTDNYILAEEILLLIDRAYLVDTTENPDIYQFFDLRGKDLSNIIYCLIGNKDKIEIRKNGEFIWPNNKGLYLVDIVFCN